MKFIHFYPFLPISLYNSALATWEHFYKKTVKLTVSTIPQRIIVIFIQLITGEKLTFNAIYLFNSSIY